MLTYYCSNCKMQTEESECSVCGKRTKLTSRLYWCKTCNIPTYTANCPICGAKGKYFTSDARPVFPEERLLIESVLGEPMKYHGHSVWNGTGNIYYVDGNKLSLHIDELVNEDPVRVRNMIQEHSAENTCDYFNEQMEKFIQANKSRYDAIVTEATAFIKESAKDYDVTSMFVSFSGGKDSTVVSSLVTKAMGNPSIIHLFGNTTLEYPDTIEYVERFKKNNRKTPVLVSQNTQQDFLSCASSSDLQAECSDGAARFLRLVLSARR